MVLTFSPWVFQLRPQKLRNKFKLSLLCPTQIPTPWVYEHNKWLFKLLSLRVICYTAIATGAQGNQGFVGWGWHFSQTSDSDQMNVNTALGFCPSEPQRWRVCYTSVSYCLFLLTKWIDSIIQTQSGFLYADSWSPVCSWTLTIY